MLKKILSMALCAIMVMGMSTTAFAQNSFEVSKPELTTTVVQDAGAMPRKVDLSKSINIDGGDSWKTSFDVGKWWPADDHNAFKIHISNVTGEYKVLINGSDGYFYESSTYTGGVTVTTINAHNEVTYSVAVVNTKSNQKASMDVKIYSYYQ